VGELVTGLPLLALGVMAGAEMLVLLAVRDQLAAQIQAAVEEEVH
jgi:hypothetical protein|tara:strand:+ start:720 stop:854 length:135 start_codon:yes stop_codon:yes gene_type:complete